MDTQTEPLGWFTTITDNRVMDVGPKLRCSDGTIVKMKPPAA